MNRSDLVKSTDIIEYCTFKVGNNFFGIPVMDVQEVIRPQYVTRVPLSDAKTVGLINLRGQIFTLLSLRQLFGYPSKDLSTTMNIVIKSDESLTALVVDEINDVIDVTKDSFESTPATLDKNLRAYVKGIHKLQGQLLIILDLNKILGEE